MFIASAYSNAEHRRRQSKETYANKQVSHGEIRRQPDSYLLLTNQLQKDPQRLAQPQLPPPEVDEQSDSHLGRSL
jgi:hypothetical protein